MSVIMGTFWTDLDELVMEIENEGVEVIEANHEYIEAVDPDGDTRYFFRLVKACGTIAVKSIEEI